MALLHIERRVFDLLRHVQNKYVRYLVSICYHVMQGFEGKESRLAAVVTLASSLDYTSSKSSLKLLTPLVSGWFQLFLVTSYIDLVVNSPYIC